MEKAHFNMICVLTRGSLAFSERPARILHMMSVSEPKWPPTKLLSAGTSLKTTLMIEGSDLMVLCTASAICLAMLRLVSMFIPAREVHTKIGMLLLFLNE